MDYNYNMEVLEGEFNLNGEELFIIYRVTNCGGIELSTYYNGDNHKIHYIDSFDNYYDEDELKYTLGLEFMDYLKTIKVKEGN